MHRAVGTLLLGATFGCLPVAAPEFVASPLFTVRIADCRALDVDLGVFRVGLAQDVRIALMNDLDRAVDFQFLNWEYVDGLTIGELGKTLKVPSHSSILIDVHVLASHPGGFGGQLSVQRDQACPASRITFHARGEAETFFAYFDPDFGYAQLGSPKKRMVLFQNLASQPVRVVRATLSAGTHFMARVVSANIVGGSPQESIEVSTLFDDARLFSDDLVVEFEGGPTASVRFALVGKGGGPQLECVRDVDFGVIPAQSSVESFLSWRTISLRNVGSRLSSDDGGVLHVSVLAQSGSNLEVLHASFGEDGGSEIDLAPGAQSTLRVELGSSVDGPLQGSLALQTNEQIPGGPVLVKATVRHLPPAFVVPDRNEVVFETADAGQLLAVEVALKAQPSATALLSNVRVENAKGFCFWADQWSPSSISVDSSSAVPVTVHATTPSPASECRGFLRWSQYVPWMPENSIPISFAGL